MRMNLSLHRRIAIAALAIALTATACSSTSDDSASADVSESTVGDGATTDAAIELTPDAEITSSSNGVGLFGSSVVHDIAIEFDTAAYDAMIETYQATAEKDWIGATVTIDGTVVENVGLRLKGNSSLFGLSTETAENPEGLPWLIRLDKYVDGQTYDGHADLVVRSNSTETAMNEAVALELLESVGLASEQAIAVAFTVNGGETELRLVIEHPDEIWAETNFDADGLLYKADSEGDYSYRGDDPDAYEDVFDQKAGDDDLTPLTEFLDFINNSDDATFDAELADHLDVEAFATYLAFQELIGNFDDIDGPGNNSYLYYDPDTGQFTVVNWDLNLAFGTSNVNGGPGGGGARGGFGAVPTDEDGVAVGRPPVGGLPATGAPATGAPAADAPAAGAPVDGIPARGGFGQGGPGGVGGNVLVDRFMANEAFAQLYEDAIVELTDTMFTSSAAADVVASWVQTLTDQAADLVDASTIQADADAILASIQGD